MILERFFARNPLKLFKGFFGEQLRVPYLNYPEEWFFVERFLLRVYHQS
jgi:hypothetical protein